MKRVVPAAILLSTAACVPYADFTLPSPGAETPLPGIQVTVDPTPVFAPGPAGSWDAVDALNPAIVRRGGLYWNLYSGFDGRAWHTGVATSADGREWTRKGRFLSPAAGTWEGSYIAANGAALGAASEIRYWYQAGDPPRIGLVRSRDGEIWVRHGQPVLEPGPYGSWDERGVGDPFVIQAGGWLYLFHLGQDRARRQRLGIARSPDGVTWQKLRSGPVLELGGLGAFDENGLGEPAVWRSHGRWWMLYTGRDRHENRAIGLAWSRDGVRWQRYRTTPVIDRAPNQPGSAWMSRVVCDPDIEALPGGSVRVWFGAGDVPHPAENIHGHIGLATLSFR